MSEERQNRRGNGASDEDCPPETKRARWMPTTPRSPTTSRLPSTAAGRASDAKRLGACRSARWLPINDCRDELSAGLPPSLLPFAGASVGKTVGRDDNTHKNNNNNNNNKTKIGQNPNRLRRLLDTHGFRTTKISSPREAVSIYKDSCRIEHGAESVGDDSFRDGKEFLLATLGLHPEQESLEKEYKRITRDAYCILLFCQKLREQYCNLRDSSAPPPNHPLVEHDTQNDADKDAQRFFREIQQTCQLAKEHIQNGNDGIQSRFSEGHVHTLIELAVNVKGKRSYRAEEWKKEYQRICVSNSTISNAYVFLLQSAHGMCMTDISLKFNSREPKYERITIYLYDPAVDEGRRPDPLLLLPGLHTMITKGPNDLVSEMIESFWTFVIRDGYFPTSLIRQVLGSQLRCFFLSGFTTTTTTTTATVRGNNSNLPIPLKANFVPTSPLSIYLHGKAGAGMLSVLLFHEPYAELVQKP